MSITLSNRAKTIKPSATLAVSAKASALKAQGIDVIDLSAGEPDATTPQAICKAAIAAINEGHTHYTPVDGIKPLKQAIADKFKKDNQLSYDLMQIIVSTGAKQVIYNACLALLNAGDEAIIPAPFWVSYPSMVELADGVSVFIETTHDNEFRITPKQLENAITDKTKLFFMCSPSNPTGMVYSKAELQALGAVLKKYPNITIISDDLYENVRWNQEDFINIATACPDLMDRVLVVNGVSKAYAMTGWRIGYAGGPKDLINGMKNIQGHATSGPCSIAQYAALEALTMDQSIIKTFNKAYQERAKAAADIINSTPLISALATDATFYIFINVRDLQKAKGFKDDVELCHALLDDAHIALVPGTAFGTPGYVRISIALAQDQLVEALSRLKKYCSQ